MPSRRRRREPSLPVQDLPGAPRAGFPLDHTARRFEEVLGDPGPVRYLIRTGPDGSRRLRRAVAPVSLSGVRRSPDIVARASLRSRSVSGSPLFRRALDCAHRVIRREVLFAHLLTGRGARSRRRRRTSRSNVKC